MRKSAFATGAAALVIAGCSSNPVTTMAPIALANPSPANAVVAVGPASPPAVVGIAREFLPDATQIQDTYAPDVPTAYLLLSADQKKSGERLCSGWMALPTREQVVGLNPAAKIAKTYWLLGPGSSPTDSCKNLVKKYNFRKADLIRASFGLPLGSLLAVHFPNGRTFYVNATEASSKQDHDILLSWYAVASTTTDSNTVLQSDSIAANMKRALCAKDSTLMASLVGSAAAVLGPFGFVVGVGEVAICKLNIV